MNIEELKSDLGKLPIQDKIIIGGILQFEDTLKVIKFFVLANFILVLLIIWWLTQYARI